MAGVFETGGGDVIGNPIISLQSDWNDLVFSSGQEIWISSSKFGGGQSVHSKLKSHGTNWPVCLSDEFSVLSFGPAVIEVRYNPTGHAFAFLAPAKTLSGMHEKKISSLDVTDKGSGVSVCVGDRLVVWNATSGEIVRTLQGHLGNVYKCRFFPSGVVILTGGADMQLKIWSAESGDCPVTLIGHRGAINDFCMVDKGRNVISVSADGTSKLWDCGKSSCLATIVQADSALNCCAICVLPESINLTREEPLNEREVGTSDKLLLIGSEGGFVYGVGVFSRKTAFTVNVKSAVNAIFTVSDKIVIGCQNGLIIIFKLIDVETPFKIIQESSSPVLCGCPYKEMGFFIGRNDGTVTYYDCLEFSNKRISLTGSDYDPIYDISLTNSNRIYTCCRDGKIRQYSVGELISKLYSSSV